MKRTIIAFLLGFAVAAVWFPHAGEIARAAQAAKATSVPTGLLTFKVDPCPIKPGRWTSKVWVSTNEPRVEPTVLPESQWPASTQAEIAKFRAGQKKWPPMFPSDDAIKVFENEKVAVYDVTLGDVDRLHRHTRDLIAIYLQDDGERRNIAIQNGLPVVTTSKEDQDTMNGTRGVSSHRYAGVAPLPHVGNYVKAGLLHSEATVNGAKNGTRREFFIELKGTEPPDCKEWSTAC